jgi:hypothetical protein
MLSILRIAVAASLLLGCKAKEQEPARVSKDPPVSTAGGAWKKNPTRDCPAYVHGADVTLADTADGVRVTIVGTADDVVAEIRDDALYLQGASEAGAGADALDFGAGPTSNRNANCPVVLDGTTLVVADIPHGVTIDVTAKDPVAMRQTAHERFETLTMMKEAMKE